MTFCLVATEKKTYLLTGENPFFLLVTEKQGVSLKYRDEEVYSVSWQQEMTMLLLFCTVQNSFRLVVTKNIACSMILYKKNVFLSRGNREKNLSLKRGKSIFSPGN